jgi:hypothetical protein
LLTPDPTIVRRQDRLEQIRLANNPNLFTFFWSGTHRKRVFQAIYFREFCKTTRIRLSFKYPSHALVFTVVLCLSISSAFAGRAPQLDKQRLNSTSKQTNRSSVKKTQSYTLDTPQGQAIHQQLMQMRQNQQHVPFPVGPTMGSSSPSSYKNK